MHEPEVAPHLDGQVCIAASFTADPLTPLLSTLLSEVGLRLAVDLAPYHQIPQQLLDPTSAVHRVGKSGVAVVLVRIEDYVRDHKSDEHELSRRVGSIVDDLSGAIAAYAARSVAPLLIVVAPPSVVAGRSESLRRSQGELLQRLRGMNSVHAISPDAVERHHAGDGDEAVLDQLAHIPYTPACYAALAICIARRIHALKRPPCKVLVLDCDNTLWQGVLGEDGPDGIRMTPAFEAVQGFALKVQGEGGLLCLASKNDDADVVAAFERRTDMPLRLEHVIARAINWNAKAANIRALATELSLGLDSFVFLDDNPVECAQVRHALPEVVTLQLPAEEQVEGFLARLWAFDRTVISDEDRRRTEAYRENRARDALESSAPDIATFLQSLQMHVEIRSVESTEWSRAAQLAQKTNQFNTTTIRYSEPELRAAADSGTTVLIVRVTDRFGDFGLCGMAVADACGEALSVSNLLLSCRVLGRGVEHALVRELGRIAVDRGLRTVDIDFTPSARNEPAGAFLDSIGAAVAPRAGGVVYRLDAGAAATLAHLPGTEPEAVVAARRGSDAKPKAHADKPKVDRGGQYERIAEITGSGERLLAFAREASRVPRPVTTAAEPPRDAVEDQLLRIWQDILNIDGLGVLDDFQDVGGTSLQAAFIFGAIRRALGVEMPITTILRHTTIRSLAEAISGQVNVDRPELIRLKQGGGASLYLIHEGNGEAMLYAHLAARMPSDIEVMAIQPPALPSVPIAIPDIEALAAHYCQLICSRQRQRPVFIGGLCAGGVLAHEMARQLQGMGADVAAVFILDAAAPGTPKLAGDEWGQRRGRFTTRMQEIRRGGSLLGTLPTVVAELMKRGANVLRTELAAWQHRRLRARQFSALAATLQDRKPWPKSLPALSAIAIFTEAESRFVPRRIEGLPFVLIKATEGVGVDRPLASVYQGHALGWDRLTDTLEIVQVPGGHSSMFTPRHVEELAAMLRSFIHRHAPVSPTRMPAPRHELADGPQ
ncbi:MAG TPA: HAD-IIIC family phosphatase [Methylibium sp.]|nr:HAD-IIIC family phosphatase [Methylibium sp.]